MNPNPRSIRKAKREWRGITHRGRHNSGGTRTGRVKEARPRGSRRGR